MLPPNSPGLYVLLLQLPQLRQLAVGRLGVFECPPGWYAYVGSACGPGGLAARIARHWRQDKPLHWHIDHLRAHCELAEVWFTVADGDECTWAHALTTLPAATLPIPHFGSSDCGCGAHLVHFPQKPDHQAIATSVRTSLSVDMRASAEFAKSQPPQLR